MDENETVRLFLHPPLFANELVWDFKITRLTSREKVDWYKKPKMPRQQFPVNERQSGVFFFFLKKKVRNEYVPSTVCTGAVLK